LFNPSGTAASTLRIIVFPQGSLNAIAIMGKSPELVLKSNGMCWLALGVLVKKFNNRMGC